MNVTEIKFNKRVKTGEYEHEDFTATATMDPGEDLFTQMNLLRTDVLAVIAGEKAAPVATLTVPAKEGKTGKGKGAKGKDTPPPAEEKEEEEEQEEEENEDEDPVDPEEEEEEEEQEEEEETPPPAEEKPAKTGKTFKKKPQVYDRDKEQHKEIFSKMLAALAPNWKKSDDTKKLGKDASVKMAGKEFLDEKGEVLDSFKKDVKKLMKLK